MKHETIEEGVVAELNGQYWGFQHGDSSYTCNDFGPLSKAEISNPQFCKKPTDMTWNPNNGLANPNFKRLESAKLVRVKKTITVEIEILDQ